MPLNILMVNLGWKLNVFCFSLRLMICPQRVSFEYDVKALKVNMKLMGKRDCAECVLFGVIGTRCITRCMTLRHPRHRRLKIIIGPSARSGTAGKCLRASFPGSRSCRWSLRGCWRIPADPGTLSPSWCSWRGWNIEERPVAMEKSIKIKKNEGSWRWWHHQNRVPLTSCSSFSSHVKSDCSCSLMSVTDSSTTGDGNDGAIESVSVTDSSVFGFTLIISENPFPYFSFSFWM